MDLIMILLVAMGIAASVANKKKKAEEQRRRAAFPEKGNPVPGSAPARNAQNRSATAKTPASSKSTTPSQRPSAPGTSKWPCQQGAQTQPQKKTAGASYGGTPKYSHVVTSTLEGGHTHTESSMTGEEACPPPKPIAQKPAAAAQTPAANDGALLSFKTNSVLQGILYAEILGKPKALQRK